MKQTLPAFIIICFLTSTCKSPKQTNYPFTVPYNHRESPYAQLWTKQYRYFESVKGDTLKDFRFDLRPDSTFIIHEKLQHGMYTLKEYIDRPPDTTFQGLEARFDGKWKQFENNIECNFVGGGEIDMIFFAKGKQTKGLVKNKGAVWFPLQTDTVYLWGHPAKAVKAIYR